MTLNFEIGKLQSFIKIYNLKFQIFVTYVLPQLKTQCDNIIQTIRIYKND